MKIVLGIVASVMGVALLVDAGFATRWFVAPVEGAIKARELTVGNGQYRIAQYDKFYDQCAAIQAVNDKIAIAVETGTVPGQTDSMQTANVLALRNQKASLIRQYNADSRKADTQAKFKASDLPNEIDVNDENINCG